MVRPPARAEADTVAYHGGVWTDGRGLATVRLPADADMRFLPPFEFSLRDLQPPSSARVTAALKDRRFTIATDQPYVKVAWRITGYRRPDPEPVTRPPAERTS